MVFRTRVVGAAALAAGLALAPAAHAEHWNRGYYNHNNGNAAGAAIIGGLVGLGLGAAIASSNGYYAPGNYAPGYYAPPYAYYGPPNNYYTPAPPPVYYGY